MTSTDGVVHRSLEEAVAEGPLPGFAEQDALAEQGEDHSVTDDAPNVGLTSETPVLPTAR